MNYLKETLILFVILVFVTGCNTSNKKLGFSQQNQYNPKYGQKDFALVFNYGVAGCEECIIKVFERLLYVNKSENYCVVLKGIKSDRSFYKQFQFLSDSIAIEPDTISPPYFCLMDKQLHTSMFFKYNPSETRLFERYLNEIHQYTVECR